MDVDLVLLSRVAYRDQEITGSRLHGLLALLAAEPRAGCSTGRLVDALWPDEQPEHPTKALQMLVSRARTRLGAAVIANTPTGYRLALDDALVDSSAVLRCAAASERHARDGDHAGALRHAEAGLALCGGAATWGDAAPDDPLGQLRMARVPTFRALTRARALALARLGRAAEAVEPLTDLVQRTPRDEEVLLELLRAEAAVAGPAAALARYDGYRRALRDELGSDPGPALRDLHGDLLRRDAPTVRHGVRHEPNELLGRAEDVATVIGLLRTSRVTSIVGPGGLGKTRLAHAVSRAAEQRVVHVVELAGVSAGGDVVGEVASALGVRGSGPTPGGQLAGPADLLAGIAATLGSGSSLLVLDNCEHVVRQAADLVQALVSTSRDLRVLTTSRAPLGLSSESVYPLPELALPTMVELFGQRARAIRPDVDLPPAVVRALCRRLDGLPLAAELAAARVRVMSVIEVAARLDDRLALLRGSSRDAPTRHRTLHAVIDWSWHLLEPDGQAAMRALSVFPGGFTASAAHAVLGNTVCDSVGVLERLVDQSLLRATDSGATTRFHMLETVREFSTARRVDAGETDSVVDRFLGWVHEFGARWQAPDFIANTEAADAIRAEQDNLVQALRYALDRDDGVTVAVAVALLGALWTIEVNLSRLSTLVADSAWALSHARPEPADVETVRAAAALGAMFGFVMPELSPLRSLATLRRLPRAAPDTLMRAVQIVLCASGPAELTEIAGSDAPLLAGMSNFVLSHLLEHANDLDGALLAARRMLACFGDSQAPMLKGLAHSRVGEMCLQVEPGEQAYHHLRTALAIGERLGWRNATLGRLALVLANLQRGAIDEAERGLAATTTDSGDEAAPYRAFELCVRGQILIGRGEVEDGLRLWRQAAERVRKAEGELTGGGLWEYEAEAVGVIVHALWHRVELVADSVAALPDIIAALAETVEVRRFPELGALLTALGLADMERGDVASGVRLVALAGRFGLVRSFHPTMAPERFRDIAERADRLAYDDAVSSYASLDEGGLRAAAAAVVRARRQITASGPA